jgi:hypothetical protein
MFEAQTERETGGANPKSWINPFAMGYFCAPFILEK